MRSIRRLALLLVALAALAPGRAHAWTHSPTQGLGVGNGANYSGNPVVTSDGAGGAFVAYTMSMLGTSNDVFVQHYDATGKALWTPGGVLVCNAAEVQYTEGICSDGAGGVIVTWQDYRAGYPNVDLYARRVNSTGTPMWTPNGVLLCNAADRQQQSDIVADGYGGAYVAWLDFRTYVTTGVDVYMQHVDGFGTLGMAAAGTALCALAGDQTEVKLAADPYNGYAVWTDNRSGSGDIYVQKFVTTGSISYSANGAVVCNAASNQSSPRIVAGAYNQMIVAWSDGRNGTDDVYAQRIDTYGPAFSWGANGISVCNATGYQFLYGLCSDGTGNFVMVWTDGRFGSTYTVFAQKVDPTGTAQWAANGVQVRFSSGSGSNAGIVADGAGGTIVVWQENRNDTGDIYAQRLNAQGATLWTSTGVPVCNAAEGQQSPRIVPSGIGGAIACWSDFRSNSYYGGMLQGIDRWGYLGAEPVMAGAGDVPNDQGGQVRVAWYASPLDYDPLFNNLTNYIVFRSVPAPLAIALSKTAPIAGASPFTVGGRTFRRFGATATTDYFWEEVAHVIPRHLTAYSAIVPTTGDSVAGSNPRTAFMVMAEASWGAAWWTSAADSTYSVDNLAPNAPAPFAGSYAAGSASLHWSANAEHDLAGYRLYRGSSPVFTPSPGNFVAEVADTAYVDPAGVTSWYKLTAIDSHGNESSAATLLPAGTLAVGDTPLALDFAAPAPNPAVNATTLRFTLPHAGAVKLAVYDAAGRHVRGLAAGAHPAGTRSVTWDLRDDAGHPVHAGLYFARLDTADGPIVRRIAVAR